MPVNTRIRSAGASHVGMVRQNNEDGWYLDPDRGIFLVVDGIGGQAAGEKAAEIAIDRVRKRLERQTGTPEDRVREAITIANNEILDAAATNPEWKGMACVLTLAVIENGHAIIGHVGDSRLYRIWNGEIEKITRDHSPVGEREDNQEISEAEAMRHPRRNEVYRDVGSQEHSPDDRDFIDIVDEPFPPDSALLLCSDGLSDQVTKDEIKRAVLANAGNPTAAVHELIGAANRAGGKDNVTILIVEGEQFAAVRPVLAPPAALPGGTLLGAKPAMFVYGFLCAVLILAVLLAARVLEPRKPDIPPPQTLLVGAGHYPSIADALAKARPGDTVEVSAGEYPEQIRLKDGVTLRGRKPDVPVLRIASEGAGPAVAVLAEGIHGARLSRFSIRADEKAPLAAAIVIANSDLELQDTEIAGADTGIEIRGKSAPVLRANSIHDCRDAGIRISGESSPWLLSNAILRNGRRAHGQKTPAEPGILISAPARAVMEGNIFQDNGAEPVRLPKEMDKDTVAKFNFFLPATPPTHNRTGGPH